MVMQISIFTTLPAKANIKSTKLIKSSVDVQMAEFTCATAPLSREAAGNLLFGGTRGSQGDSVVVMRGNRGFHPPFLVPDPSIGVPGLALYHSGTVTNGKETQFIYVGPNPF